MQSIVSVKKIGKSGCSKVVFISKEANLMGLEIGDSVKITLEKLEER